MSGQDDETVRQRDQALKRALRTPPKPHKPKRDEGGQDEPDRPDDKNC